MGDQVGSAVSGTLYYVPYKEFKRILALNVPAVEQTKVFAALCRINILYMIAKAGSGHIGSSFSSIDIMSWLHLNELRTPSRSDMLLPRDIFFSSKGHDAPALYNVWLGLGKLDFEQLHRLRRIEGLPGHPDISTPNVVTNTGSLGMGVSKAKGMIVANRLLKQHGNIYVLTGDGELQEGQFWESLISAANHKMSELTVIIDHNKLQSDTLVSMVSDLGDLEAKLSAFGWHVCRCDGNDLVAFSETLALAQRVATYKPKVIIADTIKGRGVSFMEHTSIDSDVELYKFHSGAPTEDLYIKAAQELIDSANALLLSVGADHLELENITRSISVVTGNRQRLVSEYSDAICWQARNNPRIVALNADLVLDTGLIPFQKEFPDRFVECGIAEQDMVSQAGGMALQGLLPVVHSFSCFLSARPNEQIYNNATEFRKIIYVGSLAGLVPSGPGHSHQAVRDISALGAVPGLVMMEPSCEAEVSMLFDWAVNTNVGSSYLRLVSLPVEIPYVLPDSYRTPELGKGVALTEGDDVVLIAYGPVMLAAAFQAALALKNEFSLAVKVINLPWLNVVNAEWLLEEIGLCRFVYSVDNHFEVGGQGDRIANIIASASSKVAQLVRISVDGVPACGENAECLAFHELSAADLIRKIGTDWSRKRSRLI